MQLKKLLLVLFIGIFLLATVNAYDSWGYCWNGCGWVAPEGRYYQFPSEALDFNLLVRDDLGAVSPIQLNGYLVYFKGACSGSCDGGSSNIDGYLSEWRYLGYGNSNAEIVPYGNDFEAKITFGPGREYTFDYNVVLLDTTLPSRSLYSAGSDTVAPVYSFTQHIENWADAHRADFIQMFRANQLRYQSWGGDGNFLYLHYFYNAPLNAYNGFHETAVTIKCNAPGQSCSSSNDCCTGYCEGGVCGPTCYSDADCPDGQGCSQLDYTCKEKNICGNGITDVGEECGEFGIMNACPLPSRPDDRVCLACKCVNDAPPVPEPVCGNGVVEQGEECEAMSDCTNPIEPLCFACQCVSDSPPCPSGQIYVNQKCVDCNNNSVLNFDSLFSSANMSLTSTSTCACPVTDANIVISGTNYFPQKLTGVSCSSNGSLSSFIDSNIPLNSVVSLTLSIPPPCTVCNRTAVVSTASVGSSSSIPDNNVFVVLLVLAVCLFIFIRKKK